GRHGRPHTAYLAWQLPNSYSGPHEPLPRGRQKRINRELVDLFIDGMTGNGETSVDRPPATEQPATQQPTAARFQQQRYVSGGKAAGLAARRGKAAETLYWPVINGHRRKMWYAWDVL